MIQFVTHIFQMGGDSYHQQVMGRVSNLDANIT